MKKFDDLTDIQKEYFYATGTTLSVFAVALIIPPIAWLAVPAGILCAIMTASVMIANYRDQRATAKVENK